MGLSARLKDNWIIAGEAGSLEEAKILFSGLTEKPDLVLLDVELGKEWGLEILCMDSFRALFRESPPVLIYSAYDDYAHINAALRSGVRAYICKTQRVEELLEAMEDVASGKTAFPASLIQRLTKVSGQLPGLTKREREVFSMVQRGLNNKEIANQLDVAVRTIENNLSILYDKTGVKNRRELERL